MKTLIVNGSPRRKGGTATLVSLLRQRLEGEVTVVETYFAGISPCVDCRYCWTHPACAIADGMEEVYQKISEADAIVLASPIYFAELTGSLLQWASRLQYLWISRRFRGQEALESKLRRGGILLVGGSDGHTDTAVAMASRLLRCMGAEPVGQVCLSGTDGTGDHPPEIGVHTLRQLDRLAALLQGKAGGQEKS